MIFMNKPHDPTVGCLKPFNLVGTCKAKLDFTKDLDAKFEKGVQQKEFLNPFDWFPFHFFYMFFVPH